MKLLLDALQQIKRPGSFCAGGEIESCFPGLEIKKVGTIGLPLSTDQARNIIDQCSRAPYGRGENTVVDTSVRRTWQLEPSQFKLNNPLWNDKINDISAQIKSQLGLGGSRVCHELYKLLLYEKGDFFLPHNDTEKVHNMVATLVVVLPCEFEGGQLLVRHEGQEKTFFDNNNSSYTIEYAAFYGDCQHEVKPIEHGYRLCLIYNLMVQGNNEILTAPQNSNHVKRVSSILEQWQEKEAALMLTVLLEHKYTKAGISFTVLKNLDRSRAYILFKAAEKSNCIAHLTLLTLWESGAADYSYYDHYGYEDDDHDHYEMGEVFDYSLSIDHWLDINEVQQPYGEINIDEQSIVSQSLLTDKEADEKDIEGPSGNAGVTIDRWYRRAALTIWPKRCHYAVLSQAVPQYTVPQLKVMVADWITSGKSNNDEKWLECHDFSKEIIGNWFVQGNYSFDTKDQNIEQKDMLEQLRKINDIDLVREFIQNILVKDFCGNEGTELALVCKQHGWSTFKQELKSMIENSEADKSIQFTQILRDLCCTEDNSSANQLALCQELCEKTLGTIITEDTKLVESWRWHKDDKKRTILLEALFKAMCRINSMDLLSTAVDHFMNDGKNYKMRNVLIPALKEIKSWLPNEMPQCKPYHRLLDDCLLQLKESTSEVIVDPDHWSQNIKVSCDCSDCQELNRFIKHPDEKVHRFRIRKDRRQHLHQKIDHHRCDLTHVTERIGSPYTLVCTKNRNSYKRRRSQQKVDHNLFKELKEIKQVFNVNQRGTNDS